MPDEIGGQPNVIALERRLGLRECQHSPNEHIENRLSCPVCCTSQNALAVRGMIARQGEIERAPKCPHDQPLFVCEVCWDVSELPSTNLDAYYDAIVAIAKIRVHHRGVNFSVGNPRRNSWEDLA